MAFKQYLLILLKTWLIVLDNWLSYFFIFIDMWYVPNDTVNVAW